jgi:GAF domain-containing protein
VLGADEISELFRLTGDVGELAIAPLPSGHGVRGWLAVGRPEAGLSDERLRLLEGLSYRAAMALQKARLRRHQQQSLSMADALLDHARAAMAEGDDIREHVKLAAGFPTPARCRCIPGRRR